MDGPTEQDDGHCGASEPDSVTVLFEALGLGPDAPLTAMELNLLQFFSKEGLEVRGLVLIVDQTTEDVYASRYTSPKTPSEGDEPVMGEGNGTASWLDASTLNIAATRAYAQGEYQLALANVLLALRLRFRVLGAEHPDTLTSANNLAASLQALGDFSGAHQIGISVYASRQRVLGPEHPDTLTTAGNLVSTLQAKGDLDGAHRLAKLVWATSDRVLGPEHPDTISSASNLAVTLGARGDVDGARRLHELAYLARQRDLGSEHPDTLRSANNLASSLRSSGDLIGARKLHESVWEALQRVFGPEHPSTMTSANNLATTLLDQGDVDGARRLQELVYGARLRRFGPENADTQISANNLAATLLAQGDLASARKLQESVYEGLKRGLGPEHPDTITSANSLAETLRLQGDPKGARKLQELVYAVRQQVLGPEHPDTLGARSNLASILYDQGELTSAIGLLETVYSARHRILGSEHPATLTSANNLAGALDAQGDLVGARKLQESAYAGRKSVLGPEHPDTLISAHNLADTLEALGLLPESAELCLSALDALLATPAPASSAVITACSLPLLARLSLDWPTSTGPALLEKMASLSLKLQRQLRPMPLDYGIPVYQALCALHERWWSVARLLLSESQQPTVLMAAIAPLHGPNAWAEVREAARVSEAKDHSSSAAQYLATEQVLLRMQADVQEVLQERNALREQGAPPGALLPLQQRLDALARNSEEQHRALAQAELRMAAQDPQFAERLRLAQAVEPTALQNALEPDELCLMPLPERRLQLDIDPGRWAEQLGVRRSYVYALRRDRLPQIVELESLQALAAATRLYRDHMQGIRRSIVRDGTLAEWSADEGITAERQQFSSPSGRVQIESGAGPSGPSVGGLRWVANIVREGFWKPLEPLLSNVRRLHLVTGAGQHDLMLECGQPTELGGVLLHRHCGLPAFRLRMEFLQQAPATQLGSSAPQPVHMACIVDTALDTASPIPFTALDTLIPMRQGRARDQDMVDLLARGPHSPVLVVASHGASSGNRDNPSGTLLIGDATLSPTILMQRREDAAEHTWQRTQALVALSCFGGVVGSSAQGDARGVIASLQSQGLRWAIACLAPVPDFYTPVFSAILHHELAQPDADPALALKHAKDRVTRGPWDQVQRSEILDPLREGYRDLMLRILSEAVGSPEHQSDCAEAKRSVRLLRSVLGWPIGGQLRRIFSGVLQNDQAVGLPGLKAVEAIQGTLRTLLDRPGAARRVVDDTLDTLFAGPPVWEAVRLERQSSGDISTYPEDEIVTALQSLCAVTVFFGKG